ncbi:MAG: hypothetical protein J0L92_38435 [Deltaproteobacteria bacterium]|nr:hypothetical protein [Deltaproteobacteria bacterium]
MSEVRVDPFGALWLGRRGEEITRYVDGEEVASAPLGGIADAIRRPTGPS